MIGSKSLCVALALSVVAAAAPTIRFAPAEKSTLVKTLSSDTKLHSTEVTITMDGRELPKELVGEMSISMQEHKKIVLTDRYVKVADGRPTELDRTYDELVSTTHESNKMPGQDEAVDKDKTESSELEGATVRFSWKADKEEYERTFAGEDREASLLEDLSEDTDFRDLLPRDDVKVEATWDLEGKAFRHLFAAGGVLHFHEEGKEAKKSEADSVDRQFAENLSGKGKAVFESIREKDGRKLAVVAIEAELATKAKDSESHLDCKGTMKVEGHLLWDLVANRVEAVDFTGDLHMDMSGEQSQDMGGAEHAIEIHIVLEGEVRLELSTKAG